MNYYLSIDSVISRIENQTFPFDKADYLRLKSHIENNRKICFIDGFTAIRICRNFYSVWTGKRLR